MLSHKSVLQIRANQIRFANGRIPNHHTLDGLLRLIGLILFVAFPAALLARLALVADPILRVDSLILQAIYI